MLFLIFIVGLCFGSFVNMLVYRTAVRYGLRKEIKTVSKRSLCDFCGRQLRWYENIPVVSWVIQKGRSRCCRKKLPILYPIVELLTGISFLTMLGRSQGSPVQVVMNMIIVTMLVFSAVFDAKHMVLPDFSTGVLVGLAIIRLIIFWANRDSPLQYVGSAIGASGFLGFLYLITKGKGMGLGDVKLAVFMGLWLGWPKILVAFYIAFIVGAVAGVILMARKKLKRKSLIAFGPFLILGTIIASFWGNGIVLMLDFFQP